MCLFFTAATAIRCSDDDLQHPSIVNLKQKPKPKRGLADVLLQDCDGSLLIHLMIHLWSLTRLRRWGHVKHGSGFDDGVQMFNLKRLDRSDSGTFNAFWKRTTFHPFSSVILQHYLTPSLFSTSMSDERGRPSCF